MSQSVSSAGSFNPSDLAAIIYAVNNGECFNKKRLHKDERFSDSHKTSLLSLPRWHYLVWNCHPDAWRIVYSTTRLHVDEIHGMDLKMLYIRDFVNVSLVQEDPTLPHLLIELVDGTSMVMSLSTSNAINDSKNKNKNNSDVVDTLSTWLDAMFSLLYLQGESKLGKEALGAVKADYIKSMGLPPEANQIKLKKINIRRSIFSSLSSSALSVSGSGGEGEGSEAPKNTTTTTRRSSVAMIMSAIKGFTSSTAPKQPVAVNIAKVDDDYDDKDDDEPPDDDPENEDDDTDFADDVENKASIRVSKGASVNPDGVKKPPQRRLSTFCRNEMIRRVSILTYKPLGMSHANNDDNDTITTTQSQHENKTNIPFGGSSNIDNNNNNNSKNNNSALNALFGGNISDDDSNYINENDSEGGDSEPSGRKGFSSANLVPFKSSKEKSGNTKTQDSKSYDHSNISSNNSKNNKNNNSHNKITKSSDNGSVSSSSVHSKSSFNTKVETTNSEPEKKSSPFNALKTFRRASLTVMSAIGFLKKAPVPAPVPVSEPVPIAIAAPITSNNSSGHDDDSSDSSSPPDDDDDDIENDDDIPSDDIPSDDDDGDIYDFKDGRENMGKGNVGSETDLSSRGSKNIQNINNRKNSNNNNATSSNDISGSGCNYRSISDNRNRNHDLSTNRFAIMANQVNAHKYNRSQSTSAINTNNANTNTNNTNSNRNTSAGTNQSKQSNPSKATDTATKPLSSSAILKEKNVANQSNENLVHKLIGSNKAAPVTKLDCKINNIPVNMFISGTSESTTQAGLYGNRLQWGDSYKKLVLLQVETNNKISIRLRDIQCAEVHASHPSRFRMYLTQGNCRGWLYINGLEHQQVVPFLNHLCDHMQS